MSTNGTLSLVNEKKKGSKENAKGVLPISGFLINPEGKERETAAKSSISTSTVFNFPN